MNTIFKRNHTTLDKLSDIYYNVLIDHTYNKIFIYDTDNGLNHIEDLGEDYNEWLTDDLFTYIEMTKEEISRFEDTHTLIF